MTALTNEERDHLAELVAGCTQETSTGLVCVMCDADMDRGDHDRDCHALWVDDRFGLTLASFTRKVKAPQ